MADPILEQEDSRIPDRDGELTPIESDTGTRLEKEPTFRGESKFSQKQLQRILEQLKTHGERAHLVEKVRKEYPDQVVLINVETGEVIAHAVDTRNLMEELEDKEYNKEQALLVRGYDIRTDTPDIS